MGLFGLSTKEIDNFAKDCMITFTDTAIRMGAMAGKDITTNEDIIGYGTAAMDYVLNHYDSGHFGYADMYEACGFFALQLGIVLAARERYYGKLSADYTKEILQKSLRVVGEAYLSLVNMDDEYNPLYDALIGDFRRLHTAYLRKDTKKECLKKAMLVLYLIGNTMSLEH